MDKLPLPAKPFLLERNWKEKKRSGLRCQSEVVGSAGLVRSRPHRDRTGTDGWCHRVARRRRGLVAHCACGVRCAGQQVHDWSVAGRLSGRRDGDGGVELARLFTRDSGTC
jgi:hypothetical protein